MRPRNCVCSGARDGGGPAAPRLSRRASPPRPAGKGPGQRRAPLFYQLLNNIITHNQTLVWQVETGSQADWNSAADLLKIN